MEAVTTPTQCFLFIIRDIDFDDFCKSESLVSAGKMKTFVLLPTIFIKSHPKVYQCFIVNGVEVLGSSEFPALSLALQHDQVEIVELILTNSQRSNHQQVTVEAGSEALVKLILWKNFAVSEMESSPSVICGAVDKSNLELFETLLPAKANITYRNPRGGTLLHLAVLRNNSVLVKALLAHSASIDFPQYDGSTPLHLAVQNSSDTIVSLLLEKGANADAKKYDGSTGLHLAVARKREKMFDVLLQKGASLPIETQERLRLLCLAMQNNCSNIVAKILSSGSHTALRGGINSTLLLLAIRKQLPAVVKKLLEHGVEVNTQSPDGQTVLQLAIDQESPEMVDSILNSLDRSEAKNKNMLRDLVLRDEEKFDNIVRILLRYGLTVDSKEKSNIKLLHLAVRNNYFELVQQLLDHGANINERYDNFDKTCGSEEVMPLIVAIRRGDEKMISFLLDKGADVNDVCGEFTLPIFEAVEKSSASVVKTLLDNGASIKYYPEILYNAVRRGIPDIVEALLQHGLSPNAENEYDEEKVFPIHIAAKQNNLKIIDLLLKYNADINGVVPFQGTTPLHIASKCGYLPIIEYLIRNGADIDKRNGEGISPIGVAAEEKVIDLLLQLGAGYFHRNWYVSSVFRAVGSRNLVLQAYLDDGFSDEKFLTKTGICQLFEVRFLRSRNCPRKFKIIRKTKNKTFSIFAMKLACHMIKMEAAGLCYDEKNQMPECCWNETSEKQFRKNCEAEIDQMKALNLGNCNVSLYDILVRDLHHLTRYARNNNIAKILDAKDIFERFPIYASIIRCQLRRGIFQGKLLEEGAKTFHSATKKFAKLPYELVESILSYLCDQDIIVFVNAVSPMDVKSKQPAGFYLY